MSQPTSSPLDFALDTVRHASTIAEAVYAQMQNASLSKKDSSPVTVADFSIQAYIAQQLAQQFPKDPLVAEERSEILRKPEARKTLKSVTQYVGTLLPGADADEICRWIDLGAGEARGRFWTLDPIDGTKGFIRGDQFAVALALIEDGQVQCGVLGCPRLKLPFFNQPGILAFSQRGEGAWAMPLNGEGEAHRLGVSDHNRPQDAVLLRSFETAHTNPKRIGLVREKLGIRPEPVLFDSLVKYVALAAGVGDVVLRIVPESNPKRREKIWDHAAGVLIAEEAGGRVTDIDGKTLDFSQGFRLENNRGILATNGALHDQFLKIVKEVLEN